MAVFGKKVGKVFQRGAAKESDRGTQSGRGDRPAPKPGDQGRRPLPRTIETNGA